MTRRLVFTTLAALVLGAGVLSAQTEELKAYLDRGRALTKTEKFEQALPYFLFAQELGETKFGSDSPAVVPLLNDLADLYAVRNDYPDAEPLFDRSLAIQEKELTRYRSGIARTLNSLGSLYEATARPARARAVYKRVITALEPALGGRHPSVKEARLRLARLNEDKLSTPAAAAPLAASPLYRVHLTSIRKRDDSVREWQRLRRIYPQLLTGLEMAVARADLGTRHGVWYRIQGGPLARSEAQALCTAMRARAVWCAVLGGVEPETSAPPPSIAMSGDVGSPPLPAEAGFRIHLTSIRNPDDADAEWARLRRLFVNILQDLTLTMARADLGPSRGVWYRIQGGPLGQTEARAHCASFAEMKMWCRVVPPGNPAGGSQRQVALRVLRRGPARARGTRRPRLPQLAPGARRFAGSA